jgi:predicted ATPase
MSSLPVACEKLCSCNVDPNRTKLIVITGGPGAGKTAILEILKKMLCQHVLVLPEAASIIFGGGFWRLKTPVSARAAQRAIFHVQRELETIALDEKTWALGLCDRGSIDGLAYWGPGEEDFFSSFGTSLENEYKRYQAIIHLKCPSDGMGYNHQNPLRIETAEEAKIIDDRIEEIWSKHPNYKAIPAYSDFTKKAEESFVAIKGLLPSCCQKNVQLT